MRQVDTEEFHASEAPHTSDAASLGVCALSLRHACWLASDVLQAFFDAEAGRMNCRTRVVHVDILNLSRIQH